MSTVVWSQRRKVMVDEGLATTRILEFNPVPPSFFHLCLFTSQKLTLLYALSSYGLDAYSNSKDHTSGNLLSLGFSLVATFSLFLDVTTCLTLHTPSRNFSTSCTTATDIIHADIRINIALRGSQRSPIACCSSPEHRSHSGPSSA